MRGTFSSDLSNQRIVLRGRSFTYLGHHASNAAETLSVHRQRCCLSVPDRMYLGIITRLQQHNTFVESIFDGYDL